MSERTECNYCRLQAIKGRNPGKKIELRGDPEMPGFLRVYVDGKPYGAWFLEVSEGCCC